MPPHRHTLKLLVAPVIVLVICTNVANALVATLQEENPLLLIALSSTNRNLALVANKLDAISYYVVGTLRLLISDPLFFLIGYWYGERALSWIERRSSTYGPMVRRLEDMFSKAAIPLVALAPNNYICLFAGAAGMRIGVFFAANLAGTLTRLYIIRVLGNIFSSPLESLGDFMGDYQLPIFLILAPVSAWWLYREFSSGGEIDQLVHIDEELGSAEDPDPTEHEDDE